MVDQGLVGEEILTIKWAYEDPNPINKEKNEREAENNFLTAYLRLEESKKKINEKNNKALNPNAHYQDYYNSHNNPYFSGKAITSGNDGEAGYGRDTEKEKEDYLRNEEAVRHLTKLDEISQNIGDRKNFDIDFDF